MLIVSPAAKIPLHTPSFGAPNGDGKAFSSPQFSRLGMHNRTRGGGEGQCGIIEIGPTHRFFRLPVNSVIGDPMPRTWRFPAGSIVELDTIDRLAVALHGHIFELC